MYKAGKLLVQDPIKDLLKLICYSWKLIDEKWTSLQISYFGQHISVSKAES